MSQTRKKAIITGISGQDGAYLTKLLLDKGYEVTGTYRRTSSVNFWRIAGSGVDTHPNLTLVEHDLTDAGSSLRLLERTQPDELYNLAAQSFVGVSFDQPATTAEVTGLGPLNLLEAIRVVARRRASTRRRPPRCSARCSRFRRRKRPRSIRAARTASRSCTRTG